METKVVLSLFILLSVILLGQQGTAAYYTSGTNPGFRVIVTQRGLDYGKNLTFISSHLSMIYVNSK